MTVINKESPKITVAPMMDWTDRHCRYFLRLIAPHVGLYTEMVTTGAVIHGDRDRFLRFDDSEHPVALQLGGNDPAALAECAKIGEDYGYDEINLNCGCPSDRVQNGAFGACLMAAPDRVADSVAAMIDAVDIPVTVKCRIGIDDCEELPFLNRFIEAISKVKCQHFIIHARKAWLQGLSPKENREVPPLRYDIVEQIRAMHPHLAIHVNGGINSCGDASTHLETFDGIMIGREAYRNPWFLAELESEFYNYNNDLDRYAVAREMIPYAQVQAEKYGTPVKSITRHMIGLFHGQPGGRIWRRYLSTEAFKKDADASVIEDALGAMAQADLPKAA